MLVWESRRHCKFRAVFCDPSALFYEVMGLNLACNEPRHLFGSSAANRVSCMHCINTIAPRHTRFASQNNGE